jgi:hypothetical protein
MQNEILISNVLVEVAISKFLEIAYTSGKLNHV